MSCNRALCRWISWAVDGCAPGNGTRGAVAPQRPSTCLLQVQVFDWHSVTSTTCLDSQTADSLADDDTVLLGRPCSSDSFHKIATKPLFWVDASAPLGAGCGPVEVRIELNRPRVTEGSQLLIVWRSRRAWSVPLHLVTLPRSSLRYRCIINVSL